MSGCVFCHIVDGSAPATRVFEDDRILAFLDIRPISRGHLLVIPKQHATELDDLDPDLGSQLFRVGHGIARAVRRSGLRADGANLVLNDGKAAFQTVAHVHLHVIPRQRGDILRFAKGFVLRRGSDPEGTAAAIRSGIEQLDPDHF